MLFKTCFGVLKFPKKINNLYKSHQKFKKRKIKERCRFPKPLSISFHAIDRKWKPISYRHIKINDVQILASLMFANEMFDDVNFLIAPVYALGTTEHRQLSTLVFHVTCNSRLPPVLLRTVRASELFT